MKLRCFVLATMIAGFAAGTPGQQTASPETVTAIKSGHVVDVENGRVLEKQVILLRGKKIDAIGGDLKIPAGAKILDFSSKTVLPGLIDCHSHLADGDQKQNADPFNQLRRTASQVVLESVPNTRVTLESGFTTVRDAGVYRALNDVALRDAIKKGYIVGPRMFVAGAYITISGGAGAIPDRQRISGSHGTCITPKRTVHGKCAKRFGNSRTMAPITSRCLRPGRY